jgi:hypothetical protein
MLRVTRQAAFGAGVVVLAGLVAVFGHFGSAAAEPSQVAANSPATAPITTDASAPTTSEHKHMLMQYCAPSHNDKLNTAGTPVVPLDAGNQQANQETWEKILRRLSLGEMPPRGMPRPSKEQIGDFTHWLATSLDDQATAHPNPGHATVRRMNRTEYANAVRDLLGLDVDFSKDMPADDTGYGFDNIADVLTVSPTLMDRYINVAGKVRRMTTGQSSRKVITTDYKIPKDLFINGFGVASYNERASDDLPLDSRGGGAFKFYAPYDATYTIQVFLNANTSEEGEIDIHNRFEVKAPLKAGLRTIGASFPKQLALDEHVVPKSVLGPREPAAAPVPIPLDVQVDGARVERLSVPSVATGPNVSQSFYLRDVMQISVVGPYDIKGPGDTPSRRKIFICRPSSDLPEAACAENILTNLAHHAYRRPVSAGRIAADEDSMTRAAQARFRSRHRGGAGSGAGVAQLPVHARKRSAPQRARLGASHQRPGTGPASVLLPVEQHSGRCAAGGGGAGSAAQSRGIEAPGRAHAGRSARQGADPKFRGTMAVSAPAGISEARPPGFPRFRPAPAHGDADGNRNVL